MNRARTKLDYNGAPNYRADVYRIARIPRNFDDRWVGCIKDYLFENCNLLSSFFFIGHVTGQSIDGTPLVYTLSLSYSSKSKSQMTALLQNKVRHIRVVTRPISLRQNNSSYSVLGGLVGSVATGFWEPHQMKLMSLTLKSISCIQEHTYTLAQSSFRIFAGLATFFTRDVNFHRLLYRYA